jgi:hypothetical protein
MAKVLVLAGEPQLIESSSTNGATASPGANAAWINREIDTPPDKGQHVSVAIDPSTGEIWVSYYDVTNQDLRVALYMGQNGNCGTDDSWRCQTVDSAGDVGKYSSIAIWEDKLMVAYYDASNRNLKLAMSDDPLHWVWDIVTLDTALIESASTGLYTSAQFSDTGQEFVAYYFDNPTNVDALKVAYHTYANGNCPHPEVATTWRCDTITTGEGVGQYASLDVVGGVNFEVNIAYHKGSTSELWFATTQCQGTCNCGFWDGDMACYPITGASVDAGKYASLYMDSANHFHIAYYDATKKVLKYAKQVDSGGNCGILGSAQCDTIDDMPANYHPLGISIAEDAAGYPIIAYQSAFGSLNVARPLGALGLPAGSGNCGPEKPFATWHCDTINPRVWIPDARHADYLSIAVNPGGLATIAYYGFITAAGGNLMISYQYFENFLPLVMKAQ